MPSLTKQHTRTVCAATQAARVARASRSRPARTATLVVGVAKGGVGKTTLALHVAWRAAERGWKVLFVDADRQGDGFRRLGGDDEFRVPIAWGSRCGAVACPGVYDVSQVVGKVDLIVVDTPPGVALPAGKPSADLVVLPIDGVDAATDARETIADLPTSASAWIVLNKVGLAGVRHAAILGAIEGQCPPGVAVSGVRIPIGGSIARTDWSRKPAWTDPHSGKAGIALMAWCDEVLDWLVASIR